jgi:hypothetical protein
VWSDLPLADYDVYVELPTSGATARARLQQDGQIVSLELPAPPRGSIAGKVVDESGSPLIDAWVSASPSEPLARAAQVSDPPTLTDERGEFTLSDLAPGNYELQARSSAGAGRREGVPVSSRAVILIVPHAPNKESE